MVAKGGEGSKAAATERAGQVLLWAAGPPVLGTQPGTSPKLLFLKAKKFKFSGFLYFPEVESTKCTFLHCETRKILFK